MTNKLPPEKIRHDSPTPEEIKAARAAAELSQTRAATLIWSTLRTWQDWEGGIANMHPGLWELFLLKTQRKKDTS